jgi:uncharacterized protein with HEPN domain
MWKDETTLLDIDVAAQRIAEFIEGYAFERFVADEKTWSAVLYQIGVIGEAVKRLSEPFRTAHPSIPWIQIAGMRNRVIHGYDAVDFKRVWETVTESIPSLRVALAPLLPSDADSGAEHTES